MSLVRINKFLADCGIASRRGADELIAAGKVRVNGEVPSVLGMRVDTDKDIITVNGKHIKSVPKKLVYIAVNKPRGYVSTVEDPHAEKPVIALYPGKERVYPVGRLDKDSEGLLLLTNDGSLSLKLTHPRYHVAKTYQVLVVGKVTDAVLENFQTGIVLEDGLAKAAAVRVLKKEGKGTWLELVLHEGRKRQIRRMCAEMHLHVERLVRVAIGTVQLGSLKEGAWRELREDEVRALLLSD